MTPSRLLFVTCVLAMAGTMHAQAFVNYESGPVSPMRVSADGSRLFVADTLGGLLCVFDLGNPSVPFLVAEIPVGLEPVSVHPRTRDEVWVTNLLSDSVSIVSVPDRRVVATLHVVDEPSDVVFAGGKAFVSAATRDEVQVFDAATRTPIGTVALFGKDPRALAVSPDGSRVYAVIQRSGNGTTVLPALTVGPPAVGAPEQGIIVRADDPAWMAQIPYQLPDNDVAEIAVSTLTVTRYYPAVGTTNTGIAVDPATGDLWVTNTEARNLVRYENNLRAHAIESRVTRITTGTAPTVTAFDLNAGLVYGALPDPAALASVLSEPFGVAIDPTSGRVYVAAHGTDRVGVLNFAGTVLARIEIGVTPGALVDTRHKRGPRALALHPTQNRLYVLNRLSDTLSVVDTSSQTVLGERPIASWDPMPAAMREARKFLYDAKLSGNGTMSCAACHVDGDMDGLAWDLGDLTGMPVTAPVVAQPTAVFPGSLPDYHPLKGPMTTQTLRGLAGTGPLHWRGDRANFQAFNPAFVSLMGGSQLSTQDMDDYAAFATQIQMPPNPNQRLDRALRTTPANNNEAVGKATFELNLNPGGPAVSCVACHDLPLGTNTHVFPGAFIFEHQNMKVPQLRNMYRKVGFSRTAGNQKSGFGYAHDGAVDTLASFLQKPIFNVWPDKDDIETFLLSFDTGTPPAVGYQFDLTQANSTSQQLLDDFTLVVLRAYAGELEITAHGVLDGREVGLLYKTSTGLFHSDRSSEGPFTPFDLQGKAVAGNASLLFTAVTFGTGNRIALDRDLDGTTNGDENAAQYGVATPGCVGASRLLANSEPRQGNGLFGFVVENAPANSIGALWVGAAPASTPVLGVTLLVDSASATITTTFSDANGGYTLAIPVTPAQPPGMQVFAQSTWLDACGSQSWSASRGLQFTFGP